MALLLIHGTRLGQHRLSFLPAFPAQVSTGAWVGIVVWMVVVWDSVVVSVTVMVTVSSDGIVTTMVDAAAALVAVAVEVTVVASEGVATRQEQAELTREAGKLERAVRGPKSTEASSLGTRATEEAATVE